MGIQDDIYNQDLLKKWEEIRSLINSVNSVVGHILESATYIKTMPNYDTYIDQNIKDQIDSIIIKTTGLILP